MNTFTPILEGILQRKFDFPTNIIVAYSVAIQYIVAQYIKYHVSCILSLSNHIITDYI